MVVTVRENTVLAGELEIRIIVASEIVFLSLSAAGLCPVSMLSHV